MSTFVCNERNNLLDLSSVKDAAGNPIVLRAKGSHGDRRECDDTVELNPVVVRLLKSGWVSVEKMSLTSMAPVPVVVAAPVPVAVVAAPAPAPVVAPVVAPVEEVAEVAAAPADAPVAPTEEPTAEMVAEAPSPEMLPLAPHEYDAIEEDVAIRIPTVTSVVASSDPRKKRR